MSDDMVRKQLWSEVQEFVRQIQERGRLDTGPIVIVTIGDYGLVLYPDGTLVLESDTIPKRPTDHITEDSSFMDVSFARDSLDGYLRYGRLINRYG